MSQIKDTSDCTTTTGRLIGYSYDDLSRRTSVTRGNGAGSAYAYEDTGALDTLSHTIGGGGSVAYGFDYNRALQMTRRTTDNDLYAWTNHYNVTRSYTANGLDQYGQIMGDAQAWDSRGNLLSYRGVSYGYDGENRLAAVAMRSGTATTAYDPAGRLRQIGAAVTSQLLYDGDAPIADYDASSGAIINRYVPGPGTDEIVTAYDSTGTKSWYHADAQGSVVATSDAGGSIVVVNQYGPYGEPGLVYQGRNQGRIRYTGQLYIPELAPWSGPAQPLMSYKARIYAPKLGRFLQTDPIGAADDRNLYAYVRNDPINRSDPSGLAAEAINRNVFQPIGNFVSQHKTAAIIGGGTVAIGAATYFSGGLNAPAIPEEEAALASFAAASVPSTLARVIPSGVRATTLGAPGAADVFVTTPSAIQGLDAAGIAQRLTIPQSTTGFQIFEFPTPVEGLASPVLRGNPGFIGRGFTAGGAPEYVIPNGPIPPSATVTTVP